MSKKNKNKTSLKTTESEKVIVNKEASEGSATHTKEQPKSSSFNPLELLPVLILIAVELFFWRNVIFTDKMLGDYGDGRFTALSTEHWYKFFIGKEKFSIIPVFYPIKIAIGYSDMHLGFGLLHTVFRLFGADIYLAFKLAVFSMHFIGLLAMYWLLRRTFKVSAVWSMFGTIAFAHCTSLQMLSNHPQLFAAGMLPLLLIFFAGFVNNFEVRKRRNIYAFAAIFIFVLLTYTSWYMACFTGVFSLVFMIVYWISLAATDQKPVSMLKKWISTMKWDVLIYIVYMVVLFIPFLSIYIPVMKEGRNYSYSGYFLPDPVDIINVGESNLMMGWFMKLIKINARGRDAELTVGFSVVLLAMLVVAAVKLFSKKKRREKVETTVHRSVWISIIICILLVIRWDGNAGSLWALVYEILPPARALSSVSRFFMWLCFPMAALTAVCADRIEIFKQKGKTWIAPLILVLMFVSEITKGGLFAWFEHADRKAVLDSITPAPADAECFYVIDSAKSGNLQFHYQLDAWEIAETVGIPSINAGAWYAPPGWYVWDVCGDDYENYAAMWIENNGLQNVYAYDVATGEWSRR